MKITPKKTNLEKWTLLFFGFVSTMPIIQIVGVSLYTILAIILAMYFVIEILEKRINPFNKVGNVWYCFILLSSILSSLFCLTSNMEGYWKSEQIISLLWQGAFVVFLVYFNRIEATESAKLFLKGVYFASIFQVAWGYLQYFIYKIWQISINDVFFSELLALSNDATHWKYNGEIALSGFCWHVGNMNPLIVFGYVFSENKYLKLLFVVFSLISNSRTAILGILVCIALEWLYAFKRKKAGAQRKIVGIFLSLSCLFLILMGNTIIDKVYDVYISFSEGGIDTSALTHLGYWTTVPELFEKIDIINLLFGFGLECSGYPLANWYSQYVGTNWIVECDFINQLWNTGVIGAVLVYGWWIHLYCVSSKVSNKYSIFIISLLVQGVTYNVMFKWMWLVLFAIYSVTQYSCKNDFEGV